MKTPRRSAVFLLFLLTVSVPGTQLLGEDVCDLPPDGHSQQYRTAIWGGQYTGDPFTCGATGSPTPATCTLYNRIYTDQESACINREQGTNPPDYLPTAFGATLKNYEIDIIVVGNWPGELGKLTPLPRNWYTLWDHIADPGLPGYVGYYAAQSDLVALGEVGNPRVDPCTVVHVSLSCAPVVKAGLANDCLPQNTPLGPLANRGALAPVPVPYLLAFLGDPALGFSDPNARVALEWITPCAQTRGTDSIGSGALAPEPIMGFRLEVFVDRNGNSEIDTATGSGWDPALRAVGGGCQSGSFQPLLDIAPVAGDLVGTRLTKSTVVDIGDYTGPGQVFEDPAAIEALTFRLRLLYRDDRFFDPVGGLNGVIDPICSAPSAMGWPVGNPQVFGSPAGGVPDGKTIPGTPLEVSLEPGGDLTLNWGTSCNANDTDFAIYEGSLGDFNSHTPIFCSTGGTASKTFTPGSGNTYYLVVPGNSGFEGTYGLASDGTERPPSAAACLPQSFSCVGDEDLLPPLAVTGPATGVNFNSATLTGDVTPNGFDTTASFEWGPDTSYGSSTPAEFVGNGSDAIPYSAGLTGLTSETTYHYRLVATNPMGTSYGADAEFTTGVLQGPTVIAMSATSVNHSSALLNAEVNPNGLETTFHFEWGPDTGYGNVTPTQNLGDGTTGQVVSVPISSLSPDTIYHFRGVGTNSAGTTYGDDSLFLTNQVPAGFLVNGSFTDRQGWVLQGYFIQFFEPPFEARTPPGYAAGGVDPTGIPVNEASGRLYQDVTISSGGPTGGATLSFWYNITTEESSGADDTLRVTVRNLLDELILPVVTLDNQYETPLGDYVYYSFDMSFFIGQTVRIDFEVDTDNSKPTVFRLDDVNLFPD
jgi:hypothetical protein